MAKPGKPVGTAATTRLRKLECDRECGYIVRVSRSAMDRGLPTCCCGGRLVPVALDDCFRAHERGHLTELELRQRPMVVAYLHERESVEHGQAWASGNGRRDTSGWRSAEDVAWQRAQVQEREAAAAAQARTRFARVAEPMPF